MIVYGFSYFGEISLWLTIFSVEFAFIVLHSYYIPISSLFRVFDVQK